MARLFWLLLIAGFVALLVGGASWAIAYNSVGTLLGAPPPQMGTQSTTIRWPSLSQLREEPPVWRFAFAPTLIPGAPSARVHPRECRVDDTRARPNRRDNRARRIRLGRL